MSIFPVFVNFTSLAVKPLLNVDLFFPFVSNNIHKLVSAEGFVVEEDCPQFSPLDQSQVSVPFRTDSSKYQSSADAAKADRAKIAVNVVFFNDFFIENKNLSRVSYPPPPRCQAYFFKKMKNFWRRFP